MDETYPYQPLTKGDKISVVIYRLGISLSAILIAVLAFGLFFEQGGMEGDFVNGDAGGFVISKSTLFLIFLYLSVGMSVFSIHLYESRFKRMLKYLYYLSLAALIILLINGKGDVLDLIIHKPYGPLLLIPLSCCLGFITAKEAFCFRLMEGYLLALLMPLYLFLLSSGTLTAKSASYGLIFIVVMLIFFTLRKVFMPLHYDIGDKSAYR